MRYPVHSKPQRSICILARLEGRTFGRPRWSPVILATMRYHLPSLHASRAKQAYVAGEPPKLSVRGVRHLVRDIQNHLNGWYARSIAEMQRC